MSDQPLTLPDIATRADVVKFVDDFYDLVVKDDLLGPIFVDIAAVDFDAHLPTMYQFWSSMLLGAREYSGQPFPPHWALRDHMTPAHFTRWISLFCGVIDANFQGETAETAKQRARNIAMIFQLKLGLINPETGLPV